MNIWSNLEVNIWSKMFCFKIVFSQNCQEVKTRFLKRNVIFVLASLLRETNRKEEKQRKENCKTAQKIVV